MHPSIPTRPDRTDEERTASKRRAILVVAVAMTLVAMIVAAALRAASQEAGDPTVTAPPTVTVDGETPFTFAEPQNTNSATTSPETAPRSTTSSTTTTSTTAPLPPPSSDPVCAAFLGVVEVMRESLEIEGDDADLKADLVSRLWALVDTLDASGEQLAPPAALVRQAAIDVQDAPSRDRIDEVMFVLLDSYDEMASLRTHIETTCPELEVATENQATARR